MSIVSPNCRIRLPDHFKIGIGSIVDDFCYFSTRVMIGDYSHIASGCSVAGGGAYTFALGSYCSLSSGVKVWCASDDFVNGLITVIPAELGPEPIKESVIAGDVVMEDFTAVGSNSVVMPDNVIPIGTTIGALSFVPADFSFEPWTVYAGIPIRPITSRNREAVLRQAEVFKARVAEKALSLDQKVK